MLFHFSLHQRLIGLIINADLQRLSASSDQSKAVSELGGAKPLDRVVAIAQETNAIGMEPWNMGIRVREASDAVTD